MNRPVIGIDYSTKPDTTVGLSGYIDGNGVLHITKEATGADAVAEMERQHRRRLFWYELKKRLLSIITSN